MNKKYLLSIVILILVVAGIYFYSQIRIDGTSNRTYPGSLNFNFYSVSQFKDKNPSSGTYNTEGYIVKKYECPPCPKGAMCKTCMEDNIVISEINKVLDTYSLHNTEMIIFVKNPDQFEVGKKYRFSVQVRESKSTSEPINDIELVGYNSFFRF